MWKMCVCCLSQITQKHDVSDYADSNTALSVKKDFKPKPFGLSLMKRCACL